jgi:hypothetical protein
MRRIFGAIVMAAAFALAASPETARAEEDDDQPKDAAPRPPDVVSPSGPPVARGPVRPAASAFPVRACSFRRAVCVNAPRAAPGAEVLGVLAAAERAWDTATGALELPAPEPDPATRAYDVYLADRPAWPAETAFSERDPRSRVDRASAFTVLDHRLRGCALERAVARETLRAILFRASPAIDEGSAIAQTTSLAELVVPCAGLDTSLFQSHPERPIADRWTDAPRDVGARYDEGAALWYDLVDERFAVQPGGFVRALWALSPTTTPPDAFLWNDEPDTFDVLRETFKRGMGTGSTVDDLYREIAVARATAGAPVRVDWSIDWPAKARRLSSLGGAAPTGGSYVAIRTAGAPKGARLRLEAEWEQHAKMRWAVVKLDADGHELAHVPVPAAERATEAQMTVVDLDGVATMLVVAANAGDAAYPFDPDDVVWEPHGWLLTVAGE